MVADDRCSARLGCSQRSRGSEWMTSVRFPIFHIKTSTYLKTGHNVDLALAGCMEKTTGKDNI
jgi:hypothetical protein